MKVLVTGDGGYIGAVLVPFFLAAGHQVDGLDAGWYDGCDLGPAAAETAGSARVDMRDVTAAQLAGYDAVVCLAALSNDPVGHLNPAATFSINHEGTLRLARAADRVRLQHARAIALPDLAGRDDELGDLTQFSCPPLGFPEHIGNAATEGGENLGLARRQFLKQRLRASGAAGQQASWRPPMLHLSPRRAHRR